MAQEPAKVKHSTNKAGAKGHKLTASQTIEGRVARAHASTFSGSTGAAHNGPTPSTFPIVGIGASAGGFEPFTHLLKHLPLDSGMGFVLVQHPRHESALTQLLKRTTAMPVHEVTNNLRVEADHVYVIPPNTDLGIENSALKLKPRPRGRGAHHSIDIFFEALALDQRERAIGVILSGTATDGTPGFEAIKAEGDITFVQDDSAKYDSMPRSAVAAGCVDFVLKPEHMARELARIAKHPHIANSSGPLARRFIRKRSERQTSTRAPRRPWPRVAMAGRTPGQDRRAGKPMPGRANRPPLSRTSSKKSCPIIKINCQNRPNPLQALAHRRIH